MKTQERSETLIQLYYLLTDVRKIEERLIEIKKQASEMIQLELKKELENEIKS